VLSPSISHAGTAARKQRPTATRRRRSICIPGASTIANTQSRRPYKDFSVLSVVPTDFNSHYESIQLNAEKRLSCGLQVLANYIESSRAAFLPDTPYLLRERVRPAQRC
jgi:hypothetical protein